MVGQVKVQFHRPLEVGPVGRSVGQLDPDRIDQVTGLGTFALAAVIQEKLGQVMAGPFFSRDRDPILLAQRNLLPGGVLDSQDFSNPTGLFQGDGKAHDQQAEQVLDKVEGRLAQDMTAVQRTDQQTIGRG